MINVTKFKQRQWYLLNKDRILEKAKEQRIQNKDVPKRKRPYNKESARKSHLKRNYGLTEDGYNEMIISQNNSCLICKSSFEDKKINIDHCHQTNKVRGLLCSQCNMAIGLLKDCSKIVYAMYKYLKLHSQ